MTNAKMAGTKSPRARDDKNKKRKRDTIDGETKSKRHRQQNQESKVNGNDAQTPQKSKHAKANHDNSTGELTKFRPQEVIRPSDDGEAGWRVSKPMGGRMLDIDPILTEDEQ